MPARTLHEWASAQPRTCEANARGPLGEQGATVYVVRWSEGSKVTSHSVV